MEGFLLNVDSLEEFFNRCKAKNAVTREERIAILEDMKKELMAVKLNDGDIKNQTRGKKVLKIGFKKEPK